MRKYAKNARLKRRRTKTKLGLPDLDHAKAAVLSSLRSPESQHGYRHSIDEFLVWYCSEQVGRRGAPFSAPPRLFKPRCHPPP